MFRKALLSHGLATSLLLVGTHASAQAFDLEELRQRLATPSSLQGEFEQSHWIADQEVRLHSEGRFLYQRGQRLIWHFKTPTDSVVIFRPGSEPLDDNMPVADEEEDASNDIEALLPSRSDYQRHLVDLMGGNWTALNEDYRIALEGESEAWTVSLTPLAPALELPLNSLVLEGGRWLERLEMSIANGDKLSIELIAPHPVVDLDLLPMLVEWLADRPGRNEDEAEGDEVSDDAEAKGSAESTEDDAADRGDEASPADDD